MLLKFYIDEIKNIIGSSFTEDRFITHQINMYRATYIKNKLNEGVYIDSSIYQTIPNIDMQMVDNSELSFISSPDKLLKSVRKVPRTILTRTGDSIFNVSSNAILDDNISVINVKQANYAGSGYTAKNQIYCFLYNERLYIKILPSNPKAALIDKITFRGVFENPLDLEDYYIEGKKVFNRNIDEYPLSGANWSYIKNLILNGGIDVLSGKENSNR